VAVSPIGGANALTPSNPAAQPTAAKSGEGFQRAINDLLDSANANQQQADTALEQLVTGESDNMHDVVLSVAKADLSLRLVLEIRNRLVEAYQEIMRMQM
jgi:flagellar hook-basal body complex protein FliE